jgi:transcriptional regulator with XRE-family HTH domain
MTSCNNWAILIGMSDSWPDEVTARIAAEIKRLRGERSGQWLSDRTAELGHRVSRSTISEIETGRRKSITVTDLILLAWALRVPPIRLLYPELPDGRVEIIPGWPASSIEAATWFSGETTHDTEQVAEQAEVYRGSRLVQLARERLERELRIKTLSRMIARIRNSDNPSLAEPFVEDVEAALARIDAINTELRQIDGAVVNDGG